MCVELSRNTHQKIYKEITENQQNNGANHELLGAHGLRVLWRGGTTLRGNRRLRIPAGGQWLSQVQK